MPSAPPALQVLGHVERQDLRERPLERVGHVRNRRIVRVERIDRFDQRRAEPIAQDASDLRVDEVAHRAVVGGVLDHVLAHDADANALERLRAGRGGQRKRTTHSGVNPAGSAEYGSRGSK